MLRSLNVNWLKLINNIFGWVVTERRLIALLTNSTVKSNRELVCTFIEIEGQV